MGVKLATIDLDDHAAPSSIKVASASSTPPTSHTAADESAATSRLSKVGLFQCYQRVKDQLVALEAQLHQTQQQQQQHAITTHTSSSDCCGLYAVEKTNNAGYAAAKQLLYQHFAKTFAQAWLRRSELLPELELWQL